MTGLPVVLLAPPAGGSALFRRRWSVDLEGRAFVRMPPRPRGPGATLLTAAQALAFAAPRGGRWMLAGHSLGALVAFEAVRLLEAAGDPLPDRLLVMGSRPPCSETGRSFAPVVDLEDDAFLSALVAMGAVDASLPENPLRRLFLPGLRADLRLLVGHRPVHGAAVSVPLEAWHGTSDRLAPPAAGAGWSACTSDSFALRVVEGGHFFPIEQSAAVTAALGRPGWTATAPFRGSTSETRLL
ncbi:MULTISPECIES: thioesterase II family protein [unclassified Rathayibacter]|uniref:thioesterase II family protein n=1 Tax=unclassified Rathayibacter TaxID=2609250 RepID=UPI00188C74FB|nr:MULTISPECIES: thioesterase [unclassified Rathayibacter]MBF4463180.1 thioesterase [Rathayibacter sp. VKM Ac-2879]MBF4504583.1 thioesterase [Rathayibacter sp. VKM Ac-2878]